MSPPMVYADKAKQLQDYKDNPHRSEHVRLPRVIVEPNRHPVRPTSISNPGVTIDP